MMEDSGAWEELPRRNTSSVGIVTAALERLVEWMGDTAVAEAYHTAARELGLAALADADTLPMLIARGYDTVHRQLALGGESPDYPPGDPRFRRADAALLSLLYPACPKGLRMSEKLKILDLVASLAGDYGIRRYERDNYQAGNFWWHDIRTDADPESHRKREESFLEGTEAEWFFDSWYALCCLRVAADTEAGRPDGGYGSAVVLRGQAVRHLTRAFAQITGEGMFSADGRPVPPGVPPESYNHIVDTSADPGPLVRGDGAAASMRRTWPAPSPIAPLNWAKAALTLMLAEFREDPREG
jgi:hypothetical protein